MQFEDQPEEEAHNNTHGLDFNINIQSDEKRHDEHVQAPQPPPPSSEPATLIIEPSVNLIYQFFHLLFKSLALVMYFVLNLLIDNEVLTFLLVVITTALDFWVVKNITGRKLVGLRWWSEIKEEDNTEVWIYETMAANFIPNDCNVGVFWFGQAFAFLLWGVLAFIKLISLSPFWVTSFILALICAVLEGLNFVGFYRCRGAHQKKAKDYMGRLGLRAIQSAL